MFAVIRTGGKQYRVAAEDTLTVGRLEGNPGDVIEITDVLAYGEGDNATIGTPTVEGVTIAAEIVSQGRAKTVIAFKKRRRQNSRRKRGQRQHETVLRISEILTEGKKPAARAAKAETETASEEAAPAKKPRAKKASEAAAATE
ncbi:MAG: 50S ribosomal protein L21 [Mesorhizobium amorphae]|nr:MAG: 50S ribosomal protein L21 [Mesorhizobium amorphae]